MVIELKPIGIIHTPLKEAQEAPIQSARSEITGMVEVDIRFLDGLEGIEEFSHIFLIYGFHKANKVIQLKVQPFLDDSLHGLFTTRYPVRPNPIGFSVVRVVSREQNLIHFKGADMLDGTPLLDIKPYIPEFDIFRVEKIGWYERRNKK